jgi:hypothetical protein
MPKAIHGRPQSPLLSALTNVLVGVLEREATVKSAKDMKIVAKMTRLPRGIFYWNNLGGFAALNSIGGTQLSNNHGSR